MPVFYGRQKGSGRWAQNSFRNEHLAEGGVLVRRFQDEVRIAFTKYALVPVFIIALACVVFALLTWNRSVLERNNESRTLAAEVLTGLSDTILMLPLTRGSTTKLRPVITATARATSAISALTKFSVTVLACAGTKGAPKPRLKTSTAARSHAALGRRRKEAFISEGFWMEGRVGLA